MSYTPAEIHQLNEFNNLLMWKPTEQYKLLMNAKNRYILMVSGNQGGKCNSLKTLINLASGERKRIGDVTIGEEVLTVNDNLKIEPHKVLSVIDSGFQNILSVKLKSGKEIEPTPVHPFLTINGWRQIKDLSVGDRVATPRYLPRYKTEDVDDWQYILSGYLIADGSITRSPQIVNENPGITDEIRTIVEENGHKLSEAKKGGIFNIIRGETSGGKNFYKGWLKEIGLDGKGSHEKFVPDFVFKSSNKKIGLFLSRLFSCDGWVDRRGVGYCSVSKELMSGIQTLLLNFGIQVVVRYRDVKYTYKGETSKKFAYTLDIKRYDDLVNFATNIGIGIKQEKLDKLVLSRVNEIAKENADTVPIDISYLYDLIGEACVAGGSRRSYTDRAGYELLRSARGDTVTRDKLNIIGTHFQDDHLLTLSESDIYWDTIVAIEDGGVVQTYDLEVDGTHNFVAEDVFVHNTSSVARHYVDRFLGLHPIAEKNCDYFVCKNDHTQAILSAPPGSMAGNGRCKQCDEPLELYCEPPHLRIFRFASHNLPGTAGGDAQEIKNTQYPEFKKWLPHNLIKKDINSRSPVLYVKDINGGGDILAEYVSYGQDVQATAGPQRRSIWCDEEPNVDFMEEQYPRLLGANGDVVFSMTAASRISWLYDEYYERACITYRTDAVVDSPVTKKFFGDLPKADIRNTGKDICVIQFATDDNPTLKKEAIDELFANIDDDATLVRRRYGGFAQASGRVLKAFTQGTHVIRGGTWFPEGVPVGWTHARGIDYHQRVDWHVLAMCLSPENELFIYKENRFDPGILTTYDISERISVMTGDEIRFQLSLIDPLANQIQTNTGFTTVQDLNKYFSDFKREDIGTGGYWTPWDTKSLRGREQLRLRLKNSNRCMKPFNNEVNTERGPTFLPTIWVLDTCPQCAQYLRMWRHEENKGRDDAATKDEKESVSQKWSHYPMVVEGILKERSFVPKIGRRMLQDKYTDKQRYMTGRR